MPHSCLLESRRSPPCVCQPIHPTANAHLERFHGSFKREVADGWSSSERSNLRHVITEYLEHYHANGTIRTGSRIIDPETLIGVSNGKVCRRQRLGGL